MTVKCPRCGKSVEYSEDNPWRPFCSRRCKEADLYGWLIDDEEEPDGEESPEKGNGKGQPPSEENSD
ncbi:MAG: DNA gyrase inhibitor YacG [Myxococcales bacterium]|nr:MAG: DNA gyrase inhibitor YacG [Myxococcales bacterium]